MQKDDVIRQLDQKGEDTGVEVDDTSSDEAEKINKPFNPDDIDVMTRNMTVDLLLSRVESKMIDLQPDFQRRWGVWNERRQSRLIESLLLRIPLPVLYAAEDDDERWEIVDGIQRLSTIARFIRPPLIPNEPPLILSEMEYLTAYNGKGFDGLSPRMQLRLRETELVIHLIRKGTPAEVKFNVFARINTGGVALSAQELRHAITPGPARKVLEDWAMLPEFIEATAGSVKPSRMDDREMVLRFLAFYDGGHKQYKTPDMDGFLISAMKRMNNESKQELAKARTKFKQAMIAAYDIFGNDAFRKRFDSTASRMPINKALFEAISASLGSLTQNQIEQLIAHKQTVKKNFVALCNRRDFESSISQGTGDIKKVNRRFTDINTLFNGDAK
jgi:hypothetical protein